MEHEKNNMMCDWCGRHKDGRYMWLRLLLAVLIGLFIFLAGIQIGEMRGEVYGGHMMRWHNEDGNMMFEGSMMPGQDGSTTMMLVNPSTTTAPAAPATGTSAPVTAPNTR